MSIRNDAGRYQVCSSAMTPSQIREASRPAATAAGRLSRAAPCWNAGRRTSTTRATCRARYTTAAPIANAISTVSSVPHSTPKARVVAAAPSWMSPSTPDGTVSPARRRSRAVSRGGVARAGRTGRTMTTV